ncbi:MAG: hypothetical protein M1812_003063 [Candelaria pacifica]|nr:MAG: hypothetical protein M1812_003063 [Candelaria pacifica]
MPRPKAAVSISSLIDSASEGEADNSYEDRMMPTLDFTSGTAAIVKKSRKAPTAKATNSKGPSTKNAELSESDTTNLRATRKAKSTKASTRIPLKEKKNEQITSDTEEVDDFEDEHGMEKSKLSTATTDELDASVVAVKHVVKRVKKVQPKKTKAASDVVKINIAEAKAVETGSGGSKPKRVGKAKGHDRKPSVEPETEKVIAETQISPMDLDDSIMPGAAEEIDQPTPRPTNKRTGRLRPESISRQPVISGKRAGSASDVERGGNDPALRRKLGDITKRFESLDLKYQNLRETGVKEAEANFEKLRRQTEQKTKAANDLISSLRKEVSSQTALADDSQSLRKQLATRDAEIEKLQSKVSQMSSSLSEAHNENKALSARVTASRSVTSTLQSADSKVPGSAVKSNGQSRTVMIGSAEAAQAAQAAKLKEDLYSDLTGLILRGVTRGEDTDVYDCIQTGRNGTLHFKLAVSNDGDGKHSSYEDTEFQYTPLLDGNRDRELLELLPDYLTEEITFSRMNAAKFYGRVVETLTKKYVEE